jgi:glyoxylase-like metal-dependent hydrolase (beta-lactamase superfamily II)
MTVVEMLPDLFFVQRGYLNANHFVCRADRPVLIDSAYLPHFDQTEKILSGLGVDLGRVSLIINTHCHCDHIGGNRRIQDLSGCDIALHRVGKHFIDARDDWSTWWRYYGQEAEFFDCTRGLADGDVVPVGSHEFRVLYTPGHSADGIVLYCAKDKLLISSDALWEKDIPVMTLRVEGSRTLLDALDSLEKLRRLDIRVVYPGHGGPFGDPASAIARSEKRLRTYLSRPEELGNDQLKRIMVYTVLMRAGADCDTFFDRLMATVWFPETCDFFFNREYRRKYEETISGLLGRGILACTGGKLFTPVAA